MHRMWKFEDARMPQRRRKNEWQLVQHKAQKMHSMECEKGGCADALKKQLNDRGNVQQMAYEMHRRGKDRDAKMPQDASGNGKS